MADDRSDDVASMVFEDSPQPSRYLTSLLTSTPGARRAQTINLDNPHNRAVAHPSYHIGIDAKDDQAAGTFGVRMPKLNDLESQSLASAASGRPNTYRPRTVVAAERRAKAIAKSSGANKRKRIGVNPAPGHTTTLSSAEDESADEAPAMVTRSARRRAAVVGEKKRKQAVRGHESESENEARIEVEEEEEDSDASRSPPPKKKATHKKNGSGFDLIINTQTPTTQQDRGSGLPSILKKRDSGMKVPKTLEEANQADRMLWDWRHAGKEWKSITKKWQEMTGKVPGKSTLSVRFIKLTENFAQAEGGADDLILLHYKKEVETEMETEMWQKVADKIETALKTTYLPEQLRKRYNALKKQGFEIGADIDMSDEEDASAMESATPNHPQDHDAAIEDDEDTIHARISPHQSAPLVDYSDSETGH